MAGLLGRILEGAAGGTAAGVSLGPWGALAGALGGGVLGGLDGGGPSVDEAVPEINVDERVRAYMEKFYDPSRRAAAFSGQVAGQKEALVRSLVSSGVDAGQARMIAEKRFAGAPSEFASVEAGTQADMEDRARQLYLPAAMQREEERQSYRNLARRDRGDTFKSFLPLAGQLFMGEAMDDEVGTKGILARWGIGG